MKFKTILWSSFIGTSLFMGNSMVHADTIQVKINDESRTYDQEPIMKENRVFVPIRGISEDTGATVLYSNADKKVTIKQGESTIEFVVGSTTAMVNGTKQELPESFILNKRTMLPLRFINEMLGYRVDWISAEHSVHITTNRGVILTKVLQNSEKYLGTPYLYGGTYEKNKMFDCSSFVQKVFMESGITLPRTSTQQSQEGSLVDLNNPKPGDLLFFDINQTGQISHVAIYINENTLLQATSSLGVNYTSYSKYWKDRVVLAKDIMGF
ncbi:stalk domain-containing protein [Priestia filamentosa]|uniref:C40 family peptidase n=1 Tax=Priestia filamentosa TaxID=1402861 RepID=UPI00068FE6CB